MSNIDQAKEIAIKEKAKELFFALGHINASSQEIADYVGVKRTLINYYFRSKENLFRITHNELLGILRNRLGEIYISKQPFMDKIEELIDFLISFRERYPYVEVFNIQEVNDVKRGEDPVYQPKSMEELKCFLKEIEEEMNNGLIKKYHPINFIMNIFSLISFPILIKPVLLEVFEIDHTTFSELLLERKKIIKMILFNNCK